MENYENLKRCGWSSWSIVRKTQLIGVSIGAVGTIGFSMSASLFNDPHTGGILDTLGAVQLLLCLPTWMILKLVGQETLLAGNGDQWPLVPLFLMGLVNATLLFVVGTLIGWLIQKLKKKN